MPVRLRLYSCIQDMYERYSSPADELGLENHRYVLKGCRRKFDQFIHLYHCAEEQHFIVIYLKHNLPVLIKTVYSIDEIKIVNL